jgi:hypothetical protein
MCEYEDDQRSPSCKLTGEDCSGEGKCPYVAYIEMSVQEREATKSKRRYYPDEAYYDLCPQEPEEESEIVTPKKPLILKEGFIIGYGTASNPYPCAVCGRKFERGELFLEKDRLSLCMEHGKEKGIVGFNGRNYTLLEEVANDN